METKPLRSVISEVAEDLSRLPTERSNRTAENLDLKSSLEIVHIINSQDAQVATAVKAALPQVAHGIDVIAEALKKEAG